MHIDKECDLFKLTAADRLSTRGARDTNLLTQRGFDCAACLSA